jgi:hypothetical protein
MYDVFRVHLPVTGSYYTTLHKIMSASTLTAAHLKTIAGPVPKLHDTCVILAYPFFNTRIYASLSSQLTAIFSLLSLFKKIKLCVCDHYAQCVPVHLPY